MKSSNTSAGAGERLWEPSAEAVQRSGMSDYMRWLEREAGKSFANYAELWTWSVTDLRSFWQSVATYFGVDFHSAPRAVLEPETMPGSRFFPGATLNYAECALRRSGSQIAIMYRRETAPPETLTWDQLRARVAAARAGLQRLGVGRGDCVAALLPNCPEAVIGFLATVSLGATWSICSPEFGVESVVDRFGQILPKVLIAVDGYAHRGRVFDVRESLQRIVTALPTLVATVVVPRLGAEVVQSFEQLCAHNAPLTFEPCPFDHPLWILYSSGTTGLPKAIVHGHGGIVLEHLKALALHGNLGDDSRFFWFTTTGWMMWNYLVGGLLVGATIALYEGDPTYPDDEAMFRYAAEDRISYLGVGAPFLVACEKKRLTPKDHYDFSALRTLAATGAPLPATSFGWVYEHVKADVLVASVCGGTDVCTGFFQGCPLLPVHAGELQCAALGVAVAAFDDHGRAVVDRVGELVVTAPMPSMPVAFLGDVDGAKLRASYFAEYPGVWRHGDFVELTSRGTAIVYGRSDATLNRAGIRMGTADFYRVIEAMPEIADSLVVDTGALGHEDRMWLFVVLAAGNSLTESLTRLVKDTVRKGLSPRHVPDFVVAVPAIPRTLNGKKLEVPVKRLLMGTAYDRAVQVGTLANPDALDALMEASACARARAAHENDNKAL